MRKKTAYFTLPISLISLFLNVTRAGDAVHYDGGAYIRKILIFVFRAIHGLAPSYLSDLISIRKLSSYNLRSNNELLLVPPPVSFRPTLGCRTFSYAAPVEWNSLPSSKTNECLFAYPSLATFKEHLKTYFYRKAFL